VWKLIRFELVKCKISKNQRIRVSVDVGVDIDPDAEKNQKKIEIVDGRW